MTNSWLPFDPSRSSTRTRRELYNPRAAESQLVVAPRFRCCRVCCHANLSQLSQPCGKPHIIRASAGAAAMPPPVAARAPQDEHNIASSTASSSAGPVPKPEASMPQHVHAMPLRSGAEHTASVAGCMPFFRTPHFPCRLAGCLVVAAGFRSKGGGWIAIGRWQRLLHSWPSCRVQSCPDPDTRHIARLASRASRARATIRG